MQKKPNASDESNRLKELASYHILDTLPEKQYDDITKLAAEICETPVSQITLVDETRQWYKSNQGVDIHEVPRSEGFCSHTVYEDDGLMIVENMLEDPRFQTNPFVMNDPFVRFYAGVSLIGSGGSAIGTICVLDLKPRSLTQQQVKSLQALAKVVMNMIETHRNTLELNTYADDLQQKNAELKNFARTLAHDVKSPLNSVINNLRMLNIQHSEKLEKDALELVQFAENSSFRLAKMVDGILNLSMNAHLLITKKDEINLEQVIEEVKQLLNPQIPIQFTYTENSTFLANIVAFKQVLINLMSNAIKYSDKEKLEISVAFEELEGHYRFSFEDNGRGIEQQGLKKLFKVFERVKGVDDQVEGYGLGLATVKRLIERMGGLISVSSHPGAGTKFDFTIEK